MKDLLTHFVHADEISLDRETARRVCGVDDVDVLVSLVDEAVQAGLLARYSEKGDPLPLHKSQYNELKGVRLTAKGRRHLEYLT